MSIKQDKEDLFWQLAEPLLVSGEAEEGTMMGYKCLRHKGQFFISLDKKTGNLIIKLPKETVDSMVEAGSVLPFAPNGRVFKEWAVIEDFDSKSGAKYIQQALDFAQASV